MKRAPRGHSFLSIIFIIAGLAAVAAIPIFIFNDPKDWQSIPQKGEELLVNEIILPSTPVESTYYEMRSWESVSGTKIEAKLISFNQKNVVLRTVAGKQSEIPLDFLSQRDRDFLQPLLGGASAAPPSSEKLGEMRTWTSTEGSASLAKLVKYSKFDVTVRSVGGNDSVIPLRKLSLVDRSYLATQQDFFKDDPPERKPFLQLKAFPKSRSSSTSEAIFETPYGDYDASGKTYLIQVSNHEMEPISELKIYWAGVLENRKQLKIGIQGTQEFGLESRETLEFASDVIVAVKGGALDDPEAKRLTGKHKGIIVQLYWREHMVEYFFDHHTLEELAQQQQIH